MIIMSPQKLLSSLFFLLGCIAYSQEFDADIQLRPRFEYRNGYKNLLKENESSTSFISQRSRLNINFKKENLVTKLSLQNIRTWGEVPTIATNDKNGIQVYEAWAQYAFDSKWSARIGRQIISYDNQRIFGAIDWLQQGQSHDAAVIKFENKNTNLDIGFALNASAENLVAPAVAYTTTYKNMQYAHYNFARNNLNMSLLFLNTAYEYSDAAKDIKLDYKQTFGTFITYKKTKWNTDFSIYQQTGKSNGNTLNALNAAINFNFKLTNNLQATIGYEYLSGKDQDDSNSKLRSFIPLFGTNHAFNGLMDYFYVGNHINNVGLKDAYLKLSYNAQKWQFALSPHLFYAAAKVLDESSTKMNSNLGSEIDFTTSFKVQKDIVVQAGYSQIFATKTLENLKSAPDSKTNNWCWIMVNINPKIFSSK